MSKGVTGDRSSKTNDRSRISGCTVLLLVEKMNQINSKNYWKWKKEIVREGCAWGINTTWENLQIEKHKSGRRSFCSPNWFVLSICRFSQVVFIPQAQSEAQSPFLFPIVFGINLLFTGRVHHFEHHRYYTQSVCCYCGGGGGGRESESYWNGKGSLRTVILEIFIS